MSSSSSSNSSSSKTKKKSKKSSRKSSKLSGAAASILNLSPVVETGEEDAYDFDITTNNEYDYYGGGIAHHQSSYHGNSPATGANNNAKRIVDFNDSGSHASSDDNNYGGDCNLRGLNEDDWNYDTQQQQQQSRQIYPQHQIMQMPGEDQRGGGVNTSFDSDQGVFLGGGEQQQQQQQQGHIEDDYLHQQQQQYWSAKDKREVGRRRLKAVSNSMDVPLPFGDGQHQLHHQHQQSLSSSSSRRPSGGYSVAADSVTSSVGYGSTSSAGGYTTPAINASASSSNSTAASSSSTSLIPLPGFEEADLLQRAIERRALLHNRIVAMEAAKAELEIMDDTTNNDGSPKDGRRRGDDGSRNTPPRIIPSKRNSGGSQKESRKSPPKQQLHKREKPRQQQQQQETTSMRHPPNNAGHAPSTQGTIGHHSSNKPFDEDLSDNSYHSSDLSNSDHSRNNGGNKLSKVKMGEHHRRMNELSERIKREALEFMSYESSYGDEKERIMMNSSRQIMEEGEGQQCHDNFEKGKRQHEDASVFGKEDGERYGSSNVTEHSHDDDENSSQHSFPTDTNELEGSFLEEDDDDDDDEGESYDDEEEELEGIQEVDEDDLSHGSQYTSNSSNGHRSGQKSQGGGGSSRGGGISPNQPGKSDGNSGGGGASSIIDSSAWGDGKPTPKQLSRYSNMVRLGIPDVAVLRSMERDGVSDAQSILQSLKGEHSSGGALSSFMPGTARNEVVTPAKSSSSDVTDRQDIWQRRSANDASHGNISVNEHTLQNNEGNANEGETGDDRRLTIPLCEDPNYSKYFKMLKAKVPQSWVKRVLEVDGKDARIFDLDPDRPLKDQVASVDENGNVDWGDNANVNVRQSSSSAGESSGSHYSSGAPPTPDDDSGTRIPAGKIPADTFASVKAELAAMTAKAGEMSGHGSTLTSMLRAAPSDEGSDSDGESKRPSSRLDASSTAADITSAAVAASNARMDRLRAIREGTGTPELGNGSSSDGKYASSDGKLSGLADVGRRRQSVDEIRRRHYAPPPPSSSSQTAKPRRTYPQAKTGTAAATASSQASVQSSGGGSAKKQSFDDIPLKDDPRFSKYFQMIRSRVPRSWVERVIEVDDRDPAILDLDPNQSLASQIGEDHSMVGKDENDTIDSTIVSMDASETDGSILSSLRRSPTTTPVIKEEESHGDNEEIEERRLPITQIDDKNEDDKSEASSVTFNRDTQDEKSPGSIGGIDLTKISSFLDRIDAQIYDRDSDDGVAAAVAVAAASETVDNKQSSSRFTTAEEVENRLAEIIENFGKQKSRKDDAQNEIMEKSQADIAKLSALLATKIRQPANAEQPIIPTQQQEDVEATTPRQANLESLPSLLSQVLEKMEKTPLTEKEQRESDERKDSTNRALEALFAKREALSEEEKSKPKILSEDPEYAKYFKMLKLGLPRASVVQALERDGKDVTIIDLDPNSPFAVQRKKLDEPAVPDKNAALKDLFSRRASAMKEEPTAPDKNAALQALFVKRAANAATKQQEGSAPPLRVDPEYQKYMKMLKVGMPKETVRQALERDGKDKGVADMDPEKSYASQVEKKEEEEEEDTDPPLKEEYAKFFKMLKMGIPVGAVRQALQKEGKDPNIVDMDPEKSYASHVKGKGGGDEKPAGPPLEDDPEYTKFFKMLNMGIPLGAVRQALQKGGKDPNIVDMDPEKSYASQMEGQDSGDEKDAGPQLKDDPQYAKFFKMLKMGIPAGAVRQKLQKEGKDPNVVDMDQEKSYASQIKGEGGGDENDAGPQLKDDPQYAKFFKMLKMGIPMGAVQNGLRKEGKDPNIINLDPEKSLSSQQPSKAKDVKKPAKPKPKVARKRLHWNKIDESKLHEDSFWNQAKDQSSLQLKGLDIDNEEFASLFTSEVGKPVAIKKDASADAKKPSSKQKVQLIDGRRRMNGSILLAKFKVDYKVLARQVDDMEYIEAEGNELRGMMQLLPTKDESLALRSYLPPADAPQSEMDDSIAKLGECERYMAMMLDVPDAKDKFEAMLFRAEFETHADGIRDGTKMLIQACNSVKNSERFRKLLLYALKLGNALNTGGSNEEVTAITLDSLLKLAEAKAFDRQTSVLHYLVSIVQKNDEDVLKVSEDFVPVKAAERVAMDMLAKQMKEMEKGIRVVKNVVMRNLPESIAPELPEDELLSTTPMGQFSLSATSKIHSLTNEFANAQVNFADLLQFFGEDTSMTPEAFFCTINTFVSMFVETHKELKRKQEAKERKKRIEEKRKLRELEMAAKKQFSSTDNRLG